MTCIKSKHGAIWNVYFQLLYIIKGTVDWRSMKFTQLHVKIFQNWIHLAIGNLDNI